MKIAIANQKGGVAKTTSAISLGGLLQQAGSTLIIDLDPQGNLTTGLGVEVVDDQITSYDVITEQASLADALTQAKSGVTLLPTDISLAKGETEIMSKVGNFYLLKEALDTIQSDFDFVLIDCPPSLGLLTINALSAADCVLIPVQCQFFALKGLAALLENRVSDAYGGWHMRPDQFHSGEEFVGPAITHGTLIWTHAAPTPRPRPPE